MMFGTRLILLVKIHSLKRLFIKNEIPTIKELVGKLTTATLREIWLAELISLTAKKRQECAQSGGNKVMSHLWNN